MSRPILIAWLLALTTLAVYLPVTSHGFLNLDDYDYVACNGVVQQGLTPAGLAWAFTTFHAANWHPLTWLSLMADWQIFNSHVSGFHLVNVLFHSANTALLFALLYRLTKNLWPSAVVAALFAWHPLHVESVAWISERKDVLSTFFGLLTLLNYARFARDNSRLHYWLALTCFALSLMAKPMLVTLPFVLLLLDFWPLQRLSAKVFRWPPVLEKIPFFLLAAASCVVTFIAQRSGHAVISLEVLSWPHRLEYAAVAVVRYLLKIVWPSDLAIIYPPERVPIMTVVLAVVLLAVISVSVWFKRKRSGCWLFGWLWFLGTLVPVIGLVQVGGASMADRYTYIPSIGVFVAVAFGLQELSGLKRCLAAGAVVSLILCVLLTEKQLAYWRDSETLFHHTIAITRHNESVHISLGVVFEQQKRYAEALAEYQEALRIDPDYVQIRFAIAEMLEKSGRPAEALVAYREYTTLDPISPVPHNTIGRVLAAQGNYDEAYREFVIAERLMPEYPMPHLEMAKIYFAHGRDAKAVDELRAAAWAQPDGFNTLTTIAHYLAANENDAGRDGQNALAMALKAGNLNENRQPDAADILGMAYAATGDFTNAEVCAQNALRFARAMDLDTDTLRRRLELYQKHQPWRESFGSTNAPVTGSPAKN